MTIASPGKSIDVLLCEESPGDIRLTREAFREANRLVNLHFDYITA
jgi:hypothetical protein